MNQQYYKELNKLKILSDEQINQLIISYQDGNKSALNQILESNLKLVVHYAKKYSKVIANIDVIEIDDLIGEGNIALINAVEKFNPNMNIKFSYFASLIINQRIVEFIQVNKNAMKNANNKVKTDKKIKSAIDELTQKFEQEIKVTDLKYINDYSSIEIDRYDNKMNNENAYLFKTNESLFDSDDELFDEETKSKLLIAMSKLNHNEQTVLKYYYGMMNEQLNMIQIAKKLKLSKCRIGQIRMNALEKIKKMIKPK